MGDEVGKTNMFSLILTNIHQNEFMSFEGTHDTLLDQFDFDSFLHNTDDPSQPMTSFGADFGGFESVETAGESS